MNQPENYTLLWEFSTRCLRRGMNPPGYLWIVTLILSFCMAPIWPMGFTLAGQSLKLTARLSSIILLGDSFGGMFLPWLVGQVIDLTGAQFSVYFGCAIGEKESR